jgi:hypothetical protein
MSSSITKPLRTRRHVSQAPKPTTQTRNTHHNVDADPLRRAHHKRKNYYAKQLENAQVIVAPEFDLEDKIQQQSKTTVVKRPIGWEDRTAKKLTEVGKRRIVCMKDRKYKDVAVYIPNGLRESVYGTVYDSATELTENFNFRSCKSNKRHRVPPPIDAPHGVIHTMYWHATGHRNGQLYYSRDGIAHGNSTGFRFLVRFLVSIIGILMELSPLLSALDYQQYVKQVTMVNKAPPECTLLKLYKYMPWLGVIFGANLITTAHHDNKDDPEDWAGGVCFRDFIGGKFCLPDLGVKLPFQPGDIILFKSFALEHFITSWTGRCRYFTVFSTHLSTIEDLNDE